MAIDNDPALHSKGYRGNRLLKKAGEAVEWTPELVEEYIRCSTDIIYFVENYMKIVNLNDGLVNFELYDYQKDILNTISDNRLVALLTARQVGKSVTTCAFILWYILFHDNKTCGLLANKGDTAREILGRIQLAYSYLPKWLQQGVIEQNKGSISLENGSRVIAAATSSDAIRGYSINMLFVDEAAFIENWDEFFTSVFPTIASGKETKVVLVSTPNGLNHFYEIINGADKKINGYVPIKVMWNQVPGRNEEWKEQYLGGINHDIEKFNQEMCCEFLGSSGTLIAGWKLQQLLDAIVDPSFEHEGVRQWEKPERDHRYAIVADVSRGKGLDYSASHVIDITSFPYKQVCVYRSNTTTPLDYASLLAEMGKRYNSAMILVEINDIGGQVADSLHYDYEYDNILYTQSNGRAGKSLSSGFGSVKNERGVRTTKTVKSIGCSMLKLLIEQNKLEIIDSKTIFELSTFSKKGNSFEAEEGKHDDLVMGLVLFAWMTDDSYFKQIMEVSALSEVRDKTEDQVMNDLVGFGFVSDGSLETELAQDPEMGVNWLFDRNDKDPQPRHIYKDKGGWFGTDE